MFQVNLLLGSQEFLSGSALFVEMDDVRFYILFNSISVISGQWVGDNERLCALEPRVQLKRSSPQVGLEHGTARCLTQ